MGLGDFFSDLFGGDKEPYGTLNPEQEGLTKALGPHFQSTLAQGAQPYTGQFVEPVGTAEQGSLARAGALESQGASTLTNLQDLSGFNEQFRTEIEAPTLDYFRREIQPMLEESLPTFSTARSNVLARNLQGVSENLLNKRFEAREAGKNRALAAAGQTPELSKSIAQTASIPRGIKQAGLDREYADFVRANQDQQSSVNQMLNFLGISTGSYEPSPVLQYMQALAGVGQTAAAASA